VRFVSLRDFESWHLRVNIPQQIERFRKATKARSHAKETPSHTRPFVRMIWINAMLL
jgi:hypothetical protein